MEGMAVQTTASSSQGNMKTWWQCQGILEPNDHTQGNIYPYLRWEESNILQLPGQEVEFHKLDMGFRVIMVKYIMADFIKTRM